MKTINKYFKVVLCFIAFVCCSFILAFNPSMAAVSAMEYTLAEYNMAINSINMPTKINAETEQFLIPFQAAKEANKWGEAVNAEITQIVRVVDPSGVAHDYDITKVKAVNTKEDKDYFSLVTESSKQYVKVNALNNGNYQVVYITKTVKGTGDNAVARTYYSNTYNVTVENVSYELDFTTESGLTNLYKSEVAVNSGKIEVFSVKANVVGGTDSVTLTPDQCVVVTRNGAIQELKAEGSSGTDFFKKQIAGADTVEDLTDDKYEYYINPTKTGVYTIEYTFRESTNRPTKTYSINVVEAKDLKEGKKLTVNTPNLPNMELGQTGIELPKLTVNNEYAKDIAHNVTKIEIKKQYSNIKQELSANTYTFDFTLDKFQNATSYEELAGIYEITYYVQDAYGNVEGHTTTYTTKTSYISVSSKPEVYLAYNYETEAEESSLEGKNDFEVKGNVVTDYAETSLKSNFGYSEVLLPAIYGTDSLTATKDLIFVRYLRNSNTRRIYYVDNLKVEDGKLVKVEYGTLGYNYAFQTDANDKTTKTGSPNVAQTFKFSATGSDAEFAGTYYLEYEVVSTTVKDRTGSLYMPGTTTEYSITVTKDPTTTKKSTPKVSIDNLKNSEIRPENGVSVKVTSSDEFDTRLKNAVFYFTSKVDDKDTAETNDDEVVTVTDEMLKKDVFAAYDAVKTAQLVEEDIEGKENVLDSSKFIEEMTKLGYKNFNVIKESDTANTFELESFDVAALKAADADNYKTIVVFAATLNDNTAFAVDSVKLTLKNTTESTVPTINVIDAGDLKGATSSEVSDEHVFEQEKAVKLPTLTYYDEGDSTLQMNVQYYIDSPETDGGLVFLTPTGVEYEYDLSKNYSIVNGGTITTSATGTYYVVYTAIDDAGNTNVTYFTFTVKDSSNPILSVNVSSNDKITQSGNTVTTEIGSTLDFESIVRSGDGKATDYTDISKVSIKITSDNGLSYMPSGDSISSYIFNSVGTYTVTISAYINLVENKSGYWWIDNTNTNIAVTADNAPVIKDGYWWIKGTKTTVKVRKTDSKVMYIEVTKPNIVWLQEFDIPQHATQGSLVYLPDIAASHNAVVTVNVTAPGGAEPLAGDAYKTVVGDISCWCFETNASAKGTYTVKYTATSQYGVITKEFSIKVGDSVAPTIDMEYENELAQNIVYTGTDIEYVFDVVKSITGRKFVITVNRDGEEVYSYNLGLNITDLDDSGIPTNNYSWSNLKYELKGDNVKKVDDTKYTITGTGECTLSLTITDSFNNTATKNIYFNVVSESEPEEINNTVLGTVLIVISLVILAGVIVFFIFTGNNKGGSKKTSKKIAKEIKESIEEKSSVVETKEEVVEEEVKSEVVEEKQTEAAVEEIAEATAEESTKEETENNENTEETSEDDAKTGEVE